MKKVLIGITAPNSVDLIVGQLAYLNRKGYDVALLAPDSYRVNEYCEREGIRHIPIQIERNISPFRDLKSLLLLIMIFIKEKPNVINLGTPKMSLLGMLAGYVTRVPYRIYTCRGFRFEHESGRLKYLLIFLEKITSFCAHKVFCISKSVRDLGISLNIFPLEKTRLIAKGSSNGVDLTLFSVEKVAGEDIVKSIKEDYQLQGRIVFGFVGRLVDRKGVLEMYNAFDELSKRNTNVHLLVVGRPFWDQIQDQSVIDKLNAHPNVSMVGFQPLDLVPCFLSVMDVFLLPAHWEGFGNVLIQAAAMGVPIIATDVTGIKDAVAANYNGILLPQGDHVALVKAMQLLVNDEVFRKKLGANGIQWSQNFRPEIIWKGYVELYEEPI